MYRGEIALQCTHAALREGRLLLFAVTGISSLFLSLVEILLLRTGQMAERRQAQDGARRRTLACCTRWVVPLPVHSYQPGAFFTWTVALTAVRRPTGETQVVAEAGGLTHCNQG